MNEDYCLWMGDIDPEMNESTIKKLFEIYNIYPLEIKLYKNKKADQNKDYCFIYFKNILEANNTLNELNGKPIPNSSLNFKLNWANFHISTTKTVFVGNLSPSINDASLFNFFKSKYKKVVKAKVVTENGKSKRYGFVTFKKKSEYRKCLIEMNKVYFEGKLIKVKEYIKKDESEINKNNETSNNKNENNQQNLKANKNKNDKKELNNGINNCNDKNERQLNTNKLNSNNFLKNLNLINKHNWMSNANPINDVCTSINRDNSVIFNLKDNLFNQNTFNYNYDIKENNINSLNGNEYLNYVVNGINNNFENNIINNNIGNINNGNENNSIINNNNETNENQGYKKPKLEILEEFDEITLKKKINENLNKMLEHYKKNKIINRNNVASK